jgi:alanyl-tRNA synthetase
VNEHIWANVPVETRELPYPEALQLGAKAFFSEKYGDRVRVVLMSDYSIELCGGTHVRTTGQLGLFRFTGQGGVAAGVRRIEAVTGPAAYAELSAVERQLHSAAALLKSQPEHLLRRIEQLLQERARLEERLVEARKSGGSAVSGDAIEVEGVKVTLAEANTEDRDELGRIADTFREGRSGGVLALFGAEGRGAIHIALTDDLVKRGLKAGDLVNRLAAVSGGKGGGRPHFASAGAGDPAKLPEARARAATIVTEWLQGKK